MSNPGSRHCRLCGKKLSIITRLSGLGFCSSSHRSTYAHQQQEMFLARLQMPDSIPSPPLRTAMEVTTIEPIRLSSFIKC